MKSGTYIDFLVTDSQNIGFELTPYRRYKKLQQTHKLQKHTHIKAICGNKVFQNWNTWSQLCSDGQYRKEYRQEKGLHAKSTDQGMLICWKCVSHWQLETLTLPIGKPPGIQPVKQPKLNLFFSYNLSNSQCQSLQIVGAANLFYQKSGQWQGSLSFCLCGWSQDLRNP